MSKVIGNRLSLILLWLLLSAFSNVSGQSNPVEVEQAFKEVSPLVVMITADSGDAAQAKKGTGIIIGYDQTSIYVITADHVVWNGDTPSTDVKIDLKYSNGDVVPIKDAQVLQKHHPRNAGGARGLDLAVLRFDRASYKLPLDELDFRVLGKSNELRDQERMYSVGYADNGTQWNLNPQPERFSSINGSLLLFGAFITAGYSGGPIFNNKFQLVGMISEDTSPNATAITIEAIVEKLREWSIPYKIAPGSGRIIISETDRANYPFADATASVSILLPVDSPYIKSFFDKTKAEVAAYASRYPTYDNERPRELYYTSYTEQPGRRIPDQVTMYTDSPYWPKYSEYPVLGLVVRIQSTSIHFYRSPIDPRNFNPDNPGADLSISFSKNWVAYTTLDRQIQAEQTSGRLELAQSLSHGTLEQFAWNMGSKKTAWVTNGYISSLLDLRGAQVIISTVVGNLANREDLKAAFAEVRTQTQLNYLNISLGRSISFDKRNTRRFIDRKGNPFYVYEFPKTAPELLKVLQP